MGDRVTWDERVKLVRAKFGPKGHSKQRLRGILKRVQGGDPINFAPALLDKQKGNPQKAERSHDAWRFFLTLIKRAAPEFPLKQAWRDTRGVGRVKGRSVSKAGLCHRFQQCIDVGAR